MHAALRARGRQVARGRFERLMRVHGVRGLHLHRCRQQIPTTTADATLRSGNMAACAPNLLERQFAASRPNQIWLADLTYIPTGEGWLYRPD